MAVMLGVILFSYSSVVVDIAVDVVVVVGCCV